MPPMHAVNAPTKLMRDLGYSEGYVYDPDTEEGFSGLNYFPDDLPRQQFYRPLERGFEREIKKRLDYWDETARNAKSAERIRQGPITDQTLCTPGGSIMRRSAKLVAIAAVAVLPLVGGMAARPSHRSARPRRRKPKPCRRRRRSAPGAYWVWQPGYWRWNGRALHLGRGPLCPRRPMPGPFGCRALGFWSAAAGSGAAATGAADRRQAQRRAALIRRGMDRPLRRR